MDMHFSQPVTQVLEKMYADQPFLLNVINKTHEIMLKNGMFQVSDDMKTVWGHEYDTVEFYGYDIGQVLGTVRSKDEYALSMPNVVGELTFYAQENKNEILLKISDARGNRRDTLLKEKEINGTVICGTCDEAKLEAFMVTCLKGKSKRLANE